MRRDADAHPDGHTDAYADPDTYAHSNTDPNADAYANTNANANADAYANTNADSGADAYANTNANANANANADADTDTDAGPHRTGELAPVGRASGPGRLMDPRSSAPRPARVCLAEIRSRAPLTGTVPSPTRTRVHGR